MKARWMGWALLLGADAAWAYESQCRPPAYGRGGDIEVSICEDGPAATAGYCAGGLESARGVLYGEHTWLAAQAMELAGLGGFVGTRADDPLLRLWTDGSSVGGFPSHEAAGPGAMRALVPYDVTIPEFAQLPDVSHSMSDYLLGNEHNLTPNSPRGTQADADTSHDFATHMGPVNSTHFLPQARAAYELYHGIAMAKARECRRIYEAAAPTALISHAAEHVRDRAVSSCQREALAFEAVGAHFLADAWSTGHMWQRWGSPILPETPEQQMAAIVTAMSAGLIHGWRSLARPYVEGTDEVAIYQHDQLCMPGPWTGGPAGFPVVAGEEQDDAYTGSVRFGLSGQAERHEGGGDMYVLPCFVPGGDDRRAISTAPQLQVQYDGMMGCMAAGFRAVYEAGPPVGGAAAEPFETPADCWNQRVTNHSLYLGFGITGLKATKGVIAGAALAIKPVVGLANDLGDVGVVLHSLVEQYGPQLEATTTTLRTDMPLFYFDLLWNAAEFPDGLGVADAPRPLLGNQPNGAYAAQISGGSVPYYEDRDLANWRVIDGGTCGSDADCGLGSYCDKGGPGKQRQCVPIERAVQRAFRAGEVADLCVVEGEAQLAAAVASCQASGAGSAECAACAEVVFPHLRNACDINSDEGVVVDPRNGALYDTTSVCELVGATPEDRTRGLLRVPWDPIQDDAPLTAAAAYCERGRVESSVPLQYSYDDGPPAGATDVTEGVVREERNLCGIQGRSHWWRFRKPSTDYDEVWTLSLTPRALDQQISAPPPFGFRMLILTGPECSEVRDVATAGTDRVRWEWSVPAGVEDEICVRVFAQDLSLYATYELEVVHTEGGDDPCLECPPGWCDSEQGASCSDDDPAANKPWCYQCILGYYNHGAATCYDGVFETGCAEPTPRPCPADGPEYPYGVTGPWSTVPSGCNVPGYLQDLKPLGEPCFEGGECRPVCMHCNRPGEPYEFTPDVYYYQGYCGPDCRCGVPPSYTFTINDDPELTHYCGPG